MKFYFWKEENMKIFKVTIFSVYFSRNYSKIILGVLCYIFVLYTNATTSKLEYFYKKLDKNLF